MAYSPLRPVSFDQSTFDPLCGVPDELRNASLDALIAENSTEALDNRKYLFSFLRQHKRCPSDKTDLLDARQIWRILVPFRPNLTLVHRGSPSGQRESYEWVIDSLCRWFGNAPLARIEYCQWTISALIAVMTADDLGARLAQFRAATRVLEDVLRNVDVADQRLLQSLLLAPPARTSVEKDMG